MFLPCSKVDKWKQVIDSVDQDIIPIDVIKKVVFKLENGKQHKYKSSLNIFMLSSSSFTFSIGLCKVSVCFLLFSLDCLISNPFS